MSHISSIAITSQSAIKKTFLDFWVIKAVSSFLSAPVALIYSGNEMLIRIVVVLFCIDFLLGTILAFRRKEWNSRDFFSGATKLLVYGIFLFIAVSLDAAIGYGTPFTWIMFVYIIGSDSTSILENLHALGYKTPIFLVRYLKSYEKRLEQELPLNVKTKPKASDAKGRKSKTRR